MYPYSSFDSLLQILLQYFWPVNVFPALLDFRGYALWKHLPTFCPDKNGGYVKAQDRILWHVFINLSITFKEDHSTT